MLHRLGQAISWISVIVAVFLFGFAGIVLFTQTPGDFEFFWFLVFFGVMSFGVGRAVRYALSGYTKTD